MDITERTTKTGAVRYLVRITPPGQKLKQTVGTYGTRAEAEAAWLEADRKVRRRLFTVNEWREVWLSNPTWKESTRSHNRQQTKAFAAKWGNTLVRSINRTIARAWIESRPSEHSALSAMFGAAMYEDGPDGKALLESNPFHKLVKRKTKRRNIQADWLTEDDINQLEVHALAAWGEYGLVIAGMIRFMAETGVRTGELFALKWEDFNLDRMTVTIRRNADSKNRIITLPKNGMEREIVLSSAALAAAMDGGYNEGYVFRTPRGYQFWGPAFSRYWNPVRTLFGRPKMAMYELRHYCATRLWEKTTPEVVAHQLGHTDGGDLVRRVYGHKSEEGMKDEIRRILDA